MTDDLLPQEGLVERIDEMRKERGRIYEVEGDGVDVLLTDCRTRLLSNSIEIERLKDRLAETQMLAFKWMEAHDKLHAGKPYEFPNPADLPDAIERYREALNAIVDRGPERDLKWAGMTARDIALAALKGAISSTEMRDRS